MKVADRFRRAVKCHLRRSFGAVLRVRAEDATKKGLHGTRKTPLIFALQAPSPNGPPDLCRGRRSATPGGVVSPPRAQPAAKVAPAHPDSNTPLHTTPRQPRDEPRRVVLTRRFRWIAVTFVALAALAVVATMSTSPGGPSALSHGSAGLLAARLYLEATGTPTELLDHPATSGIDGEVLVVAFPASVVMMPADAAAIARFVASGGTLIVGYSRSHGGYSERVLIETFDLTIEEVDRNPSLNPIRWWREASRPWFVTTDQDDDVLELSQPRWLPTAHEAATVWYDDSSGRAVVFALEEGSGTVVMIPAEALGNGRVGSSGCANLLARLQNRFNGTWVFDEYHHGLSAGETAASSATGKAFDLILIHLLVGYGIGVLALARRFGPAWRVRPEATGSTASFLIDVGWLHDRLGHHQEAARRLVDRSVELDPGIDTPPATDDVKDGSTLVRLARRLERSS